ncbi:MAG: tellurite resistance TerB family protein [Roseinatronobacter sp.]
MFDARQLLDQVMGALPPEMRQGQGPAGNGQLVTGALAGGVLGLLAGNKRARKLAGKTAGTALKLGGLAAVAAIGYTAWQRHKGAAGPGLQLPPVDSGFAPEHRPGTDDLRARAMMVAMIQGAKADGHIDAHEHERIFNHIEALALDADAKAFVMDELAAPADVMRVARHAATPETAAELYAATLLAMDPDTPQERLFLTRLQTALGLDAALAAQIEDAVRAAAEG